MNPSSQYFWASALQSALNGINSSNLIGVLSGVGYALLLLSFLWGVYESFLRGGDVRGFAIVLLKYGVTTLVIQNWSQVFQDGVNGFGSIASTIIHNSVNQDLTSSWTQQLQSYYSAQSSTGLSNGLEALAHIDGTLGTALINVLLTIVAVAIWPLCVEVFALVYSLWGCVLYCIGPLVIALIPSTGFSRIAKGYIQNLIIWNTWPVLIAILWAMLWAMNLTTINTLLNTDGILGYLQGINATLLVSISTLLLSLCTLLIPFVARYVLHGEFGPVGMTAVYLSQRAAQAIAAVFGGGAGAAAAPTAGTSTSGGMSAGSYGSGFAFGGYGTAFSAAGQPVFATGSSGSSRTSLPPSATPPPDGGTRYFPYHGGGPRRLPPPSA